MPEIECPHCKEAVLLDDGVYGSFDCPNCNNEFKWDRSYRPNIAVTILLVLSFLSAIGAGIFYRAASTADDFGGLGAAALAHLCLIIFCVLLLLALIVYFHQVTKPSKR